jgi:predicted short-subunit dehydrogenase-like oxidoreductase (DUF2520 family)
VKNSPLIVSIVGTGNVAYHLARIFYKEGVVIRQIISRDIVHAVDLAADCAANAVDFSSIDFSVDVILLCVKDDVIKTIASKFREFDGILVHTSGSVSLDALSSSKESAVLYPFVSMVKGIEMDFRQVDVYIEGNNKESFAIVNSLALSLSNHVTELSSPQRAALHLSAVFAQNFTNHLMVMASELLQKQGLDFGALRPLLASYFQKLNKYSPDDLQTGPAVRHDSYIINSHLSMLSKDDNMKKFYELFTNSLQQINK